MFGLLLGVTVACGTASGDTRAPAIPTFAPPTTKAAGTDAAAEAGKLPTDCERVLTANDLGALFALPLDTVSVRSIRGVPQPAVDRTERIGCTYTRTGPGAPPLMELNISRYTDEAAAANQWRINSDAQRAGSESRDVPIGAAKGVFVERPGEAVLLVAYGVDNLTFVLPSTAATDRPAADVLVDLALRVIPQVRATMPA
ncbi:hypothetical protein PA7_33600 [Pseudonocardia asaccharolytica DSM 44247 = NBRC 16224]|uniref:DUF3558 domain-containing protein n=1 Tax=Pseudonocardia asaccharolytica DSM 44247 = NBRC 16224 TaxID=1123024 RepID=A0A511D4X6_9PSEU|nr:hypothetical protein PA7_33600 [Pseudonocardia asaccharolytica DSM 44247 = NBRC 16224]